MAIRVTVDTSAFAKKLGIVCDHVEDDRAVYSMPFREDNVTIADVVHGGAIASLADTAATGAAWSTITEPGRYRGITIDLSLSFIAAARSCGVVADARVVKRGGTVCFCDVTLTAANSDELIAKCKVVYKLSRIESPQDKLAGLFAGKSIAEQQALLAGLERSGAALYRAFADAEPNAARRAELIAAAEREIANAETLEKGGER
jgi:uncharacterized protein (TIGR00369 family)